MLLPFFHAYQWQTATMENSRLERLSIEFHGAILYPSGPLEIMSGGNGEPCLGGSS